MSPRSPERADASTLTDLAAIVARTHGIVDAQQLIADGIGDNSIRRLVRSGALSACAQRRATESRPSPDTFESRCAAACRADPAGRHQRRRRGAQSVGLSPRVSSRPCPTVLVAHDRTPLCRGVELRRTNVLPLERRRRARLTAFGLPARHGCGSTAVATSTTNASSDSRNGSSTITRRCRRCGRSRVD